MRSDVRRAWCAGPLLVLLAAPGAWAQARSPWVDPPQNLAAPQTPAAEPKGSSNAAPPADPETTASSPAPAGDSASRRRVASPGRGTETLKAATTPRQSGTAPGRRDAASAVAARADSRRATLAKRAPDPSARRLAVSERGLRGARARALAEGLDSGLEVMNLQTLEGPDGRRITVLTRPTPRTMEDLLAGRMPLD